MNTLRLLHCISAVILVLDTILFFYAATVVVLFGLQYVPLHDGKLPEQTTLNGTFYMDVDQTELIELEEGYFSGGYNDMDFARWTVNVTIWGETNSNLERLIIRDNCAWLNLNSYIYNQVLRATYRVNERETCIIVLHNIATINNNITYEIKIFSQHSYEGFHLTKIRGIIAQKFMLVSHAILLLVSSIIAISVCYFLEQIMDATKRKRIKNNNLEFYTEEL